MSSRVRRRVVAVTALVACTAPVLPALAASTSVKVGDNYFVRASGTPTVTVKRTDTVTWRWSGKEKHNVTVRSGPARFASRTQRTGTFSKRLTKPGTYKLICTIHGAGDQSMTLRVR